MIEKYNVIGQMSGTSLDGIDLALCEFTFDELQKWQYVIKQAVTLSYPEYWANALANAHSLAGVELIALHKKYGEWMGHQIMQHFDLTGVDFISSHGHTVFHQPNKGFTFQMGDGAALAAITGKTVVCDFRSQDVTLGGQGAPLVPIGDELLFDEYNFCLNLGGIANVSYKLNTERVAFDICPANMPLNYLSALVGEKYDKDGMIGKTGKLLPQVLAELNHLAYYKVLPPKSLGREWFELNMIPVLHRSKFLVPDLLFTCYQHIAEQLAASLNAHAPGKLLVTGGGAHNRFLIELMRKTLNHQVHVPDKLTIDFKEALIFAFLGVLRIREQQNTLKSVTGASRNTSSGAIYLG